MTPLTEKLKQQFKKMPLAKLNQELADYCTNNSPEIVEYLLLSEDLKENALINSNNAGVPLFWAISKNSREVINLILTNKSIMKKLSVESLEDTIERTIIFDDVETFQLLFNVKKLKKGMKEFFPANDNSNMEFNHSKNPLILVGEACNKEMFKILVNISYIKSYPHIDGLINEIIYSVLSNDDDERNLMEFMEYLVFEYKIKELEEINGDTFPWLEELFNKRKFNEKIQQELVLKEKIVSPRKLKI